MDLLKACQRASIVRIERDRRGGLRVFQGSAVPAGPTPPAHGVLPQPDVEDEAITARAAEMQPSAPLVLAEAAEADQPEAEPIPIDTTAELLGRAKPRPRARTARAATAAPRS